MSKHKELTKEEVEIAKVKPAILQTIEEYLQVNSMKKGEIRVLDYGSGRGKLVAVLRKMGIQTYGVEVDSVPLENGFNYFLQNEYTPSDFLFLIGKDCKTVFSDNFFDIIISDQVFEHVENIEVVAQEFSRITKPGGVHIHTFPAKEYLLEQHLFMPAIHWLPKGLVRKWFIFLFVELRVEPFWKRLDGYSSAKKTNAYYQYSIKNTFYKSVKGLKKIFHAYDFSVYHKYLYAPGKGVRGMIKRIFPRQIQLILKKN